MRKTFCGYYPPTESELSALWANGLIVLDTNVLLNLYRYSSEARNALLELMENLKERLWLPHQVALEYHRQRIERIHAEIKNCNDFISEFEQMLKRLDESRRHPFVGSDFRKRLDEVVAGLKDEIAPSSKELENFKRADPVLNKLTALYEGKVGPEPDAETKDKWLIEGEDRYRRGIPPGFEDRKKPDERRFGDVFLWKQTLEFATNKKLPVMFVTDDAKKDWWREHGGETIGPHPALVEEMVRACGSAFHMYRPERFVEFAGKHLKRPVPPTIVEEVKEARVADKREQSGVTYADLLRRKRATMRHERITAAAAYQALKDEVRRLQIVNEVAGPYAELQNQVRREREMLERLTEPYRALKEQFKRDKEMMENAVRPSPALTELIQKEQRVYEQLGLTPPPRNEHNK